MISIERAMGRALTLARRGMGVTRPNPPVGAVLLRDGAIVGEGHHEAAGKEHAEIAAIRHAGDRARGATLLVTLAPCNHHGRTPPCAPEIVRAGIARVCFGALDPNHGSGDGIEALRTAGIDVVQGPRRREAEVLIAGFASLVERKRPRITLKVAASLDGRIAGASGDSKWISSTIARAWAHRRRREADAILVGSGTAIKDNPELTTRSVKGRSPDRFVLDSKLRTPATARVWAQDGARRVAVTTESAPPEAAGAMRSRGIEVWTLPSDAHGRPDLLALAARMGEEGYTNVLVEGGGTVAGAFFAAQLVDVAWVVMARHLLLGGGGPGWTEGLRVPSVARAPKIARTELRKLGPDWLITLVPEAATWWDPEIAHV